jgi:hypothetical protein
MNSLRGEQVSQKENLKIKRVMEKMKDERSKKVVFVAHSARAIQTKPLHSLQQILQILQHHMEHTKIARRGQRAQITQVNTKSTFILFNFMLNNLAALASQHSY